MDKLLCTALLHPDCGGRTEAMSVEAKKTSHSHRLPSSDKSGRPPTVNSPNIPPFYCCFEGVELNSSAEVMVDPLESTIQISRQTLFYLYFNFILLGGSARVRIYFTVKNCPRWQLDNIATQICNIWNHTDIQTTVASQEQQQYAFFTAFLEIAIASYGMTKVLSVEKLFSPDPSKL